MDLESLEGGPVRARKMTIADFSVLPLYSWELWAMTHRWVGFLTPVGLRGTVLGTFESSLHEAGYAYYWQPEPRDAWKEVPCG